MHRTKIINGIKRNFDLSVIYIIQNEDIIYYINILSSNFRSSIYNGVEVLIFFNNLSYKDLLINFIKNNCHINWILIYKDMLLLYEIIQISTAISSKKHLLLTYDVIKFKNNAFISLRGNDVFYSSFNCYVVSYSRDSIGEMQANSILINRKDIECYILNNKYAVSIASINDIAFLLDCYKRKLICNVVISLSTNTKIEKNYTSIDVSSVRYETLFHWKNNPFSEELCIKYLSSFQQYSIKPDAFKKKYNKIVLCQSYNEIEFIDGFMDNMALFFDGIIILDDGSLDGTYDRINHEKVLLKFQKAHSNFNDLMNRNILLDVASFFNVEWLCFMDIDERFDIRFTDIFSSLNNLKEDCLAFIFVHLWESPKLYNIDHVDSFHNGFFFRWRMFRNIGRARIITNKKKLHFIVTPYTTPYTILPVLVLHYGNLEKKNRLKKYAHYNKVDMYQDMKNYNFLLEDGKTSRVDEITRNMLIESIEVITGNKYIIEE